MSVRAYVVLRPTCARRLAPLLTFSSSLSSSESKETEGSTKGFSSLLLLTGEEFCLTVACFSFFCFALAFLLRGDFGAFTFCSPFSFVLR